MVISEPKTFQDAIKPLVHFNCFVGIGAFRQPNQSRATYVFMKLYMVFITLVNWIMNYIVLSSLALVIDSHNMSPMSFRMHKALICANLCTTLIAPLLVWIQSKNLRDCLRQMPLLDDTFRNVFGVRNEYRKQRIRLTCQVIAITLVMLLLDIFDTVLYYDKLLQMDTRSVFRFIITQQAMHQPILIFLALDVNFCAFVGYLGKKYRDMNNSLLALTDESSISRVGDGLFIISQNVTTTVSGHEVKNTEYRNTGAESLIMSKHYLLREIRQAHLEICTLSRKINLVFGIQNLYSTGISFTMITGSLYTMYSSFSRKNFTNDDFNEAISAIVWTVMYAFKIWMVNHSCWSVSSEAGRTGEVIYELLNSTMDEELQKEVQEFSLQMLQNPVRFNAHGFFTLDYTFVQGVIGSITTYLIILIQISQLSESPISNTARASNGTKIAPN